MDRRKFVKLLTASGSVGIAGNANSAFANNPGSITPIINFLLDDTDTPSNMKIVADRGILSAAPDSVGFTVDLSGTAFKTPAPDSADDYDEQFHDLYYYWDTGDSGSWTAPENVMPEWKSKQSAYGPFIRHMYTKPGTYTVSVIVIEPSTETVEAATLEIVVKDPNVVFAGANTICISTDPTDTFADAPAGSQRFTSYSQAQAALEALNAPGRLLFKRGQSFVNRWEANRVKTDLAFGAWGSGAKPIITMENGSPTIPFRLPPAYPEAAGRAVEVRFDNLSFVGEWNPIDGSGEGGAAIVGSGDISFMISDVDFKGYANVFVQDDEVVDGNRVQRAGFHYHFDNMDLTDYKSYAILTGRQLSANTTFTGCKLAQNVLAPQALAGEQGGGSLRQAFARKLYIAGCDFFHNMGHDQSNDQGVNLNPFTWASNRLIDHPGDDGASVNICNSSFEGGAEGINFATVPYDGSSTKTINGLIHNCVVVGDHTTVGTISIRYAGFTVRNNLLILPGTPIRENMGSARTFVFFAPRTGITSHNESDPQRTSPNKVYNNTMVGLRTDDENRRWAYLAVRDFQLVPGSVDENNILYRPNQTNGSTYAPLNTTTLLPWSPRNQGWRNGETGVLDTDYALDPSALAFYRPVTGSPALRSASGVVARDDMFGVERTPGRADKGAFQVS